MCEYCEKQKVMESSNSCGTAKAKIIGNEMNVCGDETKVKWFQTVYQPAFQIKFCPMCGRKLG